MDVSKQKQSAGDNSTQVIAQNVTYNIVQGVTEERVREIMHQIYSERSVQLIEMARTTACERVENLSDQVIPKMLEYDQTLEFLKDPSIQRVILAAQNTAACTDSKHDHELLSDLLIERIKNRDNRQVSFTHEKAMEVVDKIPEQDLGILSVIYFISHISIGRKQIDWWEYWGIMSLINQQLQCLMHSQDFPNDFIWIETLDALSLIKSFPQGINGLVKFPEIVEEIFKVFLCKGIIKNGPEYEEIKKNLIALGLPVDAVLMDHPFIEGNILVYWPRIYDSLDNKHPSMRRMNLTEPQKIYFEQIEKSINVPQPKDISIKTAFLENLKSFPTLKALSEWWDTIPIGFQPTAVGDLLASTNIRIMCTSLYKQHQE